MSRDQIVSLAVLGGMIFLFLWDRLRYDLVALLALLAAVLGGIVPADHAFSGFSNPVVPLIAGALVVSAAIARSGAVEVLVRWLTPLFQSHGRLGSGLRDLGLGLACRVPYVRSQMGLTLSGMKTGWLIGKLPLGEFSDEEKQ